MKHEHMMRVRIAGSQHENWSGAAFDKSMTLSAFIRFSADLVANSLVRPDQLREFAAEVQEASRLLLNLARLGA
jgi:hypothetical protein